MPGVLFAFLTIAAALFGRLLRCHAPVFRFWTTPARGQRLPKPMGRVETVTDAAGHVIVSTYDQRGRLRTQTLPLGRLHQRDWNIHDELIVETDARGHSITHHYDGLGRRERSVDAIGEHRWEHDLVGNQTSQTDRDGRLTQCVTRPFPTAQLAELFVERFGWT